MVVLCYTPWHPSVRLNFCPSICLSVCKLFVSEYLLLQFTSYQAEASYKVRPWCSAVHIVSMLQSTKYLEGYAPLKIFVNILFPANSFRLYPIKLKHDIKLDHDVEQHILFRGHCPPNINRVMPLWKSVHLSVPPSVSFSFPDNFSFNLHPTKLNISS